MAENRKYNKHEFGGDSGVHVFDQPNVYWTDGARDVGVEGDRHAVAEELGKDISDIILINAKNHTNETVVVDSIDGLDPYTEDHTEHQAVKSARKVLHWTVPLQPPENNPSLGSKIATYDGIILVGKHLADKLILITGADCTPVGIRGMLKSGEPFVAGIHAGRKGTLTGVIENAVRRLHFLGVDPRTTEVFIGPAAQEIELPLELIEQEAGQDTSWRNFVSESYESQGTKVVYNNQLDTTRRVQEQLGLDPSQIHVVDVDTVADPRTHSFRRDKLPTRNSVIIGMN
jgi:copper oxidase (laccase) domain-containing protein